MRELRNANERAIYRTVANEPTKDEEEGRHDVQ